MECLAQHFIPTRPEVREKLFDPAFREELGASDVIFALDESREDGEKGQQFLVFGTKPLTEIVQTGKALELNVATVPILPGTDEFEMLLAAVRVTKGYHDLEPMQ
jgi:hypothetical protein